MPITCEVVRSADAWEALTEEWLALWRSDPAATPFQHPAWLLPWWRQFGQADLRVFVIRDRSALLALLPLYVLPNSGSGERQLLLVGAGTSDYLDGIFSPPCEPEDLRPVIDLLAQEGGWDRAHFTQLRARSPLLRALEGLAGAGIARYEGEACGKRPAVPMRGLPPKLRAEVLYRRNAAAGLGKLALELAGEQTWEPMLRQLVRFHTERWEQAGEPGVLADPRVLAHHREAIPRLLASGLLRLCALRAGSEVLGVLYSFADPPERAGRTQYFYLMGFAPERSSLRPGTLLTAFATEQAAETGLATIDMLRGDESYKKFWHVERVGTFGISFDRAAIVP